METPFHIEKYSTLVCYPYARKYKVMIMWMLALNIHYSIQPLRRPILQCFRHGFGADMRLIANIHLSFALFVTWLPSCMSNRLLRICLFRACRALENEKKPNIFFAGIGAMYFEKLILYLGLCQRAILTDRLFITPSVQGWWRAATCQHRLWQAVGDGRKLF